jgi:hypothetical protein
MVHTDQLEVGGTVAFISGIGRLNDLWGDLVNYFRDLSLTAGEVWSAGRQGEPALRRLELRSDRAESCAWSRGLSNR